MAAYNTVLLEAPCPACGRLATLACQTHVAAEFGGDDTGRFCVRDYRLGDRMAWWPPDHRRYSGWKGGNRVSPIEDLGRDEECCYAGCGSCGAELYAVIRFEDLTPVALVEIGPEQEWPAGYRK